MSDCSWLSDRMPVVALGRAEWTASEIEHLGACPSCQREWELLRVTARLGDRVAAELDAGAITRVLQQRLGGSDERTRKRRAWGFVGMAAAAVFAGLLLSSGAEAPLPGPPVAPVVAGLQIPLPELEELQPAELDSLLRGMDQPAPDLDSLDTTTDPGAAEAAELETVDDYWEG
jgi:hypothetical protein